MCVCLCKSDCVSGNLLLTYSVLCLCGCLHYSNCMQQILESVDYCHQMNVVHRDLKVCCGQKISSSLQYNNNNSFYCQFVLK